MTIFCRLLIVVEAAVALMLLGCSSVPTQNKYCDNISWYCNDPAQPICLTNISTCVPVGWTCYDTSGNVVKADSDGNPVNFSHCGPVQDAGIVDMATPPDMTRLPDLTPPPDLTPDVHFKPDIQADIDALGCAAVGCHAVSSGLYAPLLQAMPGTLAEMQNYNNFMVDANGGAAALVLTKPLMGSGVTHGGGAPGTKPFVDTNDPTYKRWVLWLSEGARY
jgi:hypothetical protein